jgi:hypothetical protein
MSLNFSEMQNPEAFSLIRMPATLGISNRVKESLRITVGLKIMCQDTKFIKQILCFLVYDGSCIVKTLN